MLRFFHIINLLFQVLIDKEFQRENRSYWICCEKYTKIKKKFIELGYYFDENIEDIDRNIVIAFGQNGQYRIELVQPLNNKVYSPVDKYIKDIGNTPYHICYITEDLNKDICKLQDLGFHVISPPQPAMAFNGKKVVFLIGLGIGLIELVESI